MRVTVSEAKASLIGFLFLTSLSSLPPFFVLAASPVPSPLPSTGISGSPTPNGSAAPVSDLALTPTEAKALLVEFIRAQKTELKALEHRYQFELKELKASQSARLKEWEKKEQDARHQFFADHPKGPDRRAYVQDFIQRREALRKMLKDEKAQRAHEQEARSTAIKQDQVVKLKDFKKALEAGKRPSSELWPRPGI